MSESELEEVGTGDAAKRIGQAPTTTTDPERSSRNTAAGSGCEPGEGPVQPDDSDPEPVLPRRDVAPRTRCRRAALHYATGLSVSEIRG